jgi:hypothetical protein
MTADRNIVRWESTTDPSLCGVEVAGQALREPRGTGTSELLKPTFVLAALGASRPADVAVAVARASAAYGNARPCMAMQAGALLDLDMALLRQSNISVVLDEVDERTPLSAVSAESVEAVRFAPGFVARAMSDGRLACVLDAMLGLAHDLGIATLGSGAGEATPGVQRFGFDYVSRQAR